MGMQKSSRRTITFPTQKGEVSPSLQRPSLGGPSPVRSRSTGVRRVRFRYPLGKNFPGPTGISLTYLRIERYTYLREKPEGPVQQQSTRPRRTSSSRTLFPRRGLIRLNRNIRPAEQIGGPFFILKREREAEPSKNIFDVFMVPFPNECRERLVKYPALESASQILME